MTASAKRSLRTPSDGSGSCWTGRKEGDNSHFLYSVHGDAEYATAFSLDRETGHAKLLNRGAIGGRNGVRQAVDPTGKFLIVANYSSGSIAVLHIAPDGSLKDQHQLVALPGDPGPNKVEQASSIPMI